MWMEVSTPSINLIAVGILFGIVQIFFLFYLLLIKRDHKSSRYFALFLAVILLSQVESFLNRSGYMGSIPHLLNISTPLIFLFGPLIYFYTNAWLKRTIPPREKLLHLLPFLLYFAYSFFFFLQPEAYKYNAFVHSFQPGLETLPVQTTFDADPWNIQGIVVVELLTLHILSYAAFILIRLRKLKRSQPEIKLTWLVFCNSMLAIGGIILFLSQGGIVNGNRLFWSLIPAFSADLFPTAATYVISLYLLKNGLPTGPKLPKYYKLGISKELRSAQLNKIISTIEQNSLFANPGFSLKMLADSCALSTHHISQVLNEEMGCTFFELTNKYRIEEAKRVLAESSDYIKMEQLAYELGYKSKSTFFTAFKRATSLTPLKYQESRAA